MNLDCLSTSLRACFSSWSTACSTRLSTSGMSGERMLASTRDRWKGVIPASRAISCRFSLLALMILVDPLDP